MYSIRLLTGGNSAAGSAAAGAASDAGRTTGVDATLWWEEATSADLREGVAGTFLSKIFDLTTTLAGSFISEANMSFNEICKCYHHKFILTYMYSEISWYQVGLLCIEFLTYVKLEFTFNHKFPHFALCKMFQSKMHYFKVLSQISGDLLIIFTKDFDKYKRISISEFPYQHWISTATIEPIFPANGWHITRCFWVYVILEELRLKGHIPFYSR